MLGCISFHLNEVVDSVDHFRSQDLFRGCKVEQKIHLAPDDPPMSCESNGSDLVTINVRLGSTCIWWPGPKAFYSYSPVGQATVTIESPFVYII